MIKGPASVTLRRKKEAVKPGSIVSNVVLAAQK